MQQPSPHRLPEIWSLMWNRPLGVGESAAPIDTRRRNTTRPSSRSVTSRAERSASTLCRTVRTRIAAVFGTQPTTPLPSTSLSTANQSPRRSTTRSRRTDPNGVFHFATASVLLAGALRIATFAFRSSTSTCARDCASEPPPARPP